MKQYWDRANHRIRNQVLLRALPVLVVSVGLMGLAGWFVFIDDAVEQRAQGGEHFMGDLVRSVDDTAIHRCLARSGDHPVAEPGPGEALRRSWIRDNARFLKPEYRPASWSGLARAEEPRHVGGGREREALLFAPVLSGGRAWQPVLLLGEETEGPFFLPVDQLVPPLPGGIEICLVDQLGRVAFSTDARWPVGRTRPAGTPTGDDAVGADLVGRWYAPSLALELRSAQPGWRVHCLDPMSDLHRTVGVFMLVMFLTAALVVGGTVVIIQRVLNTASIQLESLSAHMEALARGEFSGRMTRLRQDEVGALAGYFNIMAASLEESHRQVKERASHLRAALENMRMLDQAKDDFLVLISHEVRTPLTAIKGGVDFLRKAAAEKSGSEREVLESINLDEITHIIQSSSERLSEFMTDAIQMTSLGSAEAKLDLQAVAVRDVLGGCLLGVENLAQSKQVSIHNQLGDDVSWHLLCDPEVLGLGLEKILHNAVKHNHEGGVVNIREAVTVPGMGTVADLIETDCLRRLEGQKAFRDYEDEDVVWRLVEIFNTGTPIPPERRAALFGKFELVGRIQNHQKGSGLSVPIAKAAVESHGGRLLLSTDDKEGNSFFLLLPTLEAETVARLESGDKLGEGVRGGTWDEDIGQAGNPAALDVELDDLCAAILGSVDQTGGGVDGPGGAHHQEDVTVGRGGE